MKYICIYIYLCIKWIYISGEWRVTQYWLLERNTSTIDFIPSLYFKNISQFLSWTATAASMKHVLLKQKDTITIPFTPLFSALWQSGKATNVQHWTVIKTKFVTSELWQQNSCPRWTRSCSLSLCLCCCSCWNPLLSAFHLFCGYLLA